MRNQAFHETDAGHPFLSQISELANFRNKSLECGNALLVPTDVLLPNRTTCVVLVEGGNSGERVTLTDQGGALASVLDSGISITPSALRAAEREAKKLGFMLEGSALRSTPIELNDIGAGIRQAAFVMTSVAKVAFDHAKKHAGIRYRDRVRAQLEKIFGITHIHPDFQINGASNERLRFDYGISIQGTRLLFDAPVPDVNSIASVVLRHRDMKSANDKAIRQVIAYDEQDQWPPTSLAQLRLADVPLIDSRYLEENLHRII